MNRKYINIRQNISTLFHIMITTTIEKDTRYVSADVLSNCGWMHVEQRFLYFFFLSSSSIKGHGARALAKSPITPRRSWRLYEPVHPELNTWLRRERDEYSNLRTIVPKAQDNRPLIKTLRRPEDLRSTASGPGQHYVASTDTYCLSLNI